MNFNYNLSADKDYIIVKNLLHKFKPVNPFL